MNRAFSLFNVRSFNDGERIIEGLATSAVVDRAGDVVEPKGAQFKLPLPLLLDHDSTQVVGWVEAANVTDKGITFRARIAKIDEPGRAKDRVDEAWQLVRHRLKAAVSIGFRALKGGVEALSGGGTRFKAWEWLELSIVSIPANQEALIFSTKKLDDRAVATLRSIDTKFVAKDPPDRGHVVVKLSDRPKRKTSAAPPHPLMPQKRTGKTMFLTPLHEVDAQIADIKERLKTLQSEHTDAAEKLDDNRWRAIGKALRKASDRLSELHVKRANLIAGEDDEPQAVRRVAQPQPTASPTANRQWNIKHVAEVDYPTGWQDRDDLAIDDIYQRFLDHNVAEYQKRFADAGVDPDHRPSIELVTQMLGMATGFAKWQAQRLREAEERLDSALKRIDEIEASAPRYRGVWTEAQFFRSGSLVTHDGSMWSAKIDSTGVRPGDGNVWQLCVKRGRDGKDAR